MHATDVRPGFDLVLPLGARLFFFVAIHNAMVLHIMIFATLGRFHELLRGVSVETFGAPVWKHLARSYYPGFAVGRGQNRTSIFWSHFFSFFRIGT